jgi:hypothetical protein
MALSAPLLTRKRVIKVSLETTKGSVVTPATDVLVFDLQINPTSPFEQRKGSGLFLGAGSPGVLAERSGQCTFKAELLGNGSHGLDAGLAILLQAANFAKSSETYQNTSSVSSQKCISIGVSEDGVFKELIGAMGEVSFDGTAGGRVILSFDFKGIWVAPTDVALPAYAPSTRAPLRMQSGTFTLASLAIKISKFSLKMNNLVTMRGDVTGVGGIAHYLIGDYDPEISIDPEADLVAGYDFFGSYLAGTSAALSLVVTDSTDIVTFTIPKVQYKDIKEGDRGGIQIYDITGQCLQTSDTVDAAVKFVVT